MALETGTYISDLNVSNPAATDGVTQADDHLRLIKSTVKATFPNVSGAVTPTHTELNYVDGVTSAIQTQLDALTAGKQPLDASLTSYAALTTAANKGIYYTGADTPTTFDLTAYGRSLLDDADATAARTTLGLGSLAVLNTADIASVPTGSLLPYAGASAPAGYLFCFGQAVSRATYAALFTALSTLHGAGDGSTTFNLPDLRGRAVAGKDDMGGTSANRLTGLSGGVDGDVLGGSGGAESHLLLTAEMPSHTHTFTYGTNDVNGGGGSFPMYNAGSIVKTTSAIGGGGAHNNIQPTLILNYIIKL